MGWNFDDEWVYVPRNKFREKAVTLEPVTATAAASTVPPAEEWIMIKSMLFRVLKGFPEAFDAVVDGLRQLQIELQQQPFPKPIRC